MLCPARRRRSQARSEERNDRTIEELRRKSRLVATKDERVELEKIQGKEDLKNLVDEKIKAAQSSELKWKSDRRHGLRKVGAKIEKYGERFSDFIDKFSVVADLISQSAGVPYASAPYKSLSLFFMVAASKSRIEDNISMTLDVFGEAFPSWSDLVEIAKAETAKEGLRRISVNVEIFANEAILYYKSYGARRWLHAIFHLSEDGFDKLRSDIENDVKLIKDRAMLASQKTIERMEGTIKKLEGQIEIVKTESERHAQESREWRQNDLLRAAKQYLLVQDLDMTKIRQYRMELEVAAYSDDTISSFKFQDLQENPQYQQWESPGKSGILLLKGHSVGPEVDHSWLSRSTIDVQDAFQEKPDYMTCAFFLEGGTREAHDKVAHAVLQSLIWQILVQSCAPIDSVVIERLKSAAESKLGQSNGLNKHFAILSELLAKTPRICIILDRIDRCSGWIALIDYFLDLVRNTTNECKVFLVWGNLQNFNIKNLTKSGSEDNIEVVDMIQRYLWD